MIESHIFYVKVVARSSVPAVRVANAKLVQKELDELVPFVMNYFFGAHFYLHIHIIIIRVI